MSDATPAAADRRAPHGRSLCAAAVLIALGVYSLTAVRYEHLKSPQGAYFDHLADAFLHARLHLENPPGQHDLTPYDGRWYVPFPPLPALLLMPWVAASGVAGASTVAFSIGLGTVNVWLTWMLLAGLARRGFVSLAGGDRFWLTIMFAIGTVHWQVAVDGQVWFLGHVCTLTFVLLAAWLAVATQSPWLAGAALAIAALGRPNVVLTLPLLHALAQARGGGCDPPGPQPAPDTLRLLADGLRGWNPAWLWRALIPIAVAASALMSYNVARFGDPLDFGYTRQRVDASVLGDLHTHGQFSLHHVVRNVNVLLLGLPRIERGERLPTPDERGMSVLLTTPALLLVLRARGRDPLTRSAWLATGLLLVPLLLYYNTGWRQFGYRFSLDFLTPLLVLMALGARGRLPHWTKALVLVGIAVNAWGVDWWFGEPRAR